MTQTCYTGGTWGTVGSPPPGSLFSPERGGAQSEPGGWFDSRPLPGTPPTGTGAATDFSGKRPSKFGPPWGGGSNILITKLLKYSRNSKHF